MMLKRLPPARARELVAAAAEFPSSNPAVSYPSWYVRRWHFLPEGYLSRRSAAWYEHIIRHVYNQGLEARTLRAVIAELRRISPESVLEVGCGPGRLLERAAEHRIGNDLVGVDLSPYLLERAARRLRDRAARLVHADGLRLPADEGAFELGISSHYVGHLPARLREAAVLELARVVRPGGHVVALEHRWHPWPATPALKLLRRSVHSVGTIGLSLFERTELPTGQRP